MNADSSDYEQAAASDAWSENSSYSGVNKNYMSQQVVVNFILIIQVN